MHEKLTEEKLEEILEAGIREFAARGMEKARMGEIAAKAGISVGVLYKYFGDKESFFLSCVRRSIRRLEEALNKAVDTESSFLECADRLICVLQGHAREHENDIRMYQEVTSGRDRRYTETLAGEIEAVTAKLYTKLIRKAQKEGAVREDADPGMFAFFFDNLLMMLQFSLCCDYYRKRWNYYCHGTAEDAQVRRQLMKFLEGAFTEKRGDTL